MGLQERVVNSVILALAFVGLLSSIVDPRRFLLVLAAAIVALIAYALYGDDRLPDHDE